MKLSELGLNRFMYKEVQDIKTSDSSNMSSDPYAYQKQSLPSQTKIGGGEDASNILPGTIIRNCIIITDDLNTKNILIEDVGGNPIGAFSTFGLGSSISLRILNDFGYEWHPTHFNFVFNESEPMPNVDLGTPTLPWNIVYANQIGDGANKTVLNGSVVACPLPTVPDALEIIRKIPPPSFVGDRGHFGDKLYFDDLTFPKEVLHEVNGKQEIEHTMMIGLLMKAVVELTSKVDNLEKEIALIKK